MASVRLTPRAEADLHDIWAAIAVENEAAADALFRRILDKVRLAATQPRTGTPRPELGPEARILIEGRYVIIYEPERHGLVVVAVVHGMRDPSLWL